MRVGLVAGMVLMVLVAGKAGGVKASEGIFELRNRVGEDARCFAFSVLMQNLEYQILATCRDISYPGGPQVFSYVAWANPLDGDTPIRLGTLDLGKVQFETREAFSSIFVTKEIDARTRTPGGTVVMQGGLQNIGILETGATGESVKMEPELGEAEPLPSTESTPEPEQEASQKKSANILRIGGLAAFVLLFLIVGIVLVITKK